MVETASNETAAPVALPDDQIAKQAEILLSASVDEKLVKQRQLSRKYVPFRRQAILFSSGAPANSLAVLDVKVVMDPSEKRVDRFDAAEVAFLAATRSGDGAMELLPVSARGHAREPGTIPHARWQPSLNGRVTMEVDCRGATELFFYVASLRGDCMLLCSCNLASSHTRYAVDPEIEPELTNAFLDESADAEGRPESDEDGTLDSAMEARRARDYKRSADILRSIEATSGRARRALLQGLILQRSFGAALEHFASLPDSEQAHPAALRCYVIASANLRQIDAVGNVLLEGALRGGKDSIRLIGDNLAFLGALGEPLRDFLITTVAEKPDVLRGQFAALAFCAHTSLESGRHNLFRRVRNRLSRLDLSELEAAACEALDGQAAFAFGMYRLQASKLSEALARWHAAPIELVSPERPVTVDNIACPAVQVGSVDGPLVSVIITTFNREDLIGAALASIQNQTYRNLEILVVDDASTDRTCEIVSRFGHADSRIRLIRQSVNRGTYTATNQALRVAAGTYVTCQGSDDWAHPQKIARAVRTLEADHRATASTLRHIRCSATRGFQFRGSYFRVDLSSLLYRREPVIAALGHYDSVRAGADAEFIYRLERVFGSRAVVKLNDLLSIVNWSDQSLTGGGAFAVGDGGVLSPARARYKEAYLRWHEEAASLFLDFPLASRHFPVEPEMLP